MPHYHIGYTATVSGEVSIDAESPEAAKAYILEGNVSLFETNIQDVEWDLSEPFTYPKERG